MRGAVERSRRERSYAGAKPAGVRGSVLEQSRLDRLHEPRLGLRLGKSHPHDFCRVQKGKAVIFMGENYEIIRSFTRTANSFACTALLVSLARSAVLIRSLVRILAPYFDALSLCRSVLRCGGNEE